LTSIEKSGGLVIGGGEYDSISVSGGLVCRGSLKVWSLEVSGGVSIGGDLVVEEAADVSGGVTVSGVGRCGELQISGGGRFDELISDSIYISGGLTSGRIRCGILKLSGGLNSGNVQAEQKAHISGKVKLFGDLYSKDVFIEFSSDSEVTGHVIGTDIIIKPNPIQPSSGTIIGSGGVVTGYGSGISVTGSNISISAGPSGTSVVGDIVVQGLGDKIILTIAGRKHVLPPGYLNLTADDDRVDAQIEGKHYIFNRRGERIGAHDSPLMYGESKVSPWRFQCKSVRGQGNVELTNVTAGLATGTNIKRLQGCNISKIERL
jgi:hypothetical protein